jgi:hypothetical protein
VCSERDDISADFISVKGSSCREKYFHELIGSKNDRYRSYEKEGS